MIDADSENYIVSGGYKIWIRKRHDSGLPIVLCNGGPGCCDYLEPVAALFDDAQLIHFEHRGCGRSEVADAYSIQTSLEDLEAVRKYYGFEEWIVLGHSWGADLALFYALEYPQHTKGFICLAGGRIHNDRDWSAAYRQGRDAGLEAELDYAYPHNLDVSQQVNASWKDYIKQANLLKKIALTEVKALFIYGQQDIRPSWPIEQVASLLPNSELILLEEANHYLWQSNQSEVEHLKDSLNSFVH